jgi:hypothetical protein
VVFLFLKLLKIFYYLNISIYAASDYFVYNINSIGDGPRSKKRSKSLISNYREFFDENLKKLKDELIDAKKVFFCLVKSSFIKKFY